jgi:hypothetical protein
MSLAPDSSTGLISADKQREHRDSSEIPTWDATKTRKHETGRDPKSFSFSHQLIDGPHESETPSSWCSLRLCGSIPDSGIQHSS